MKYILIILTLTIFNSCGSSQNFLKSADKFLKGNDVYKPSEKEVVEALKEALTQGTVKGTEMVSKTDGYLKNEAIKILFPPEVAKAEETMRKYGLGDLADNIIVSFNRAAEAAASEAKPIFVQAIKDMSIQDAMDILLGEDDAATNYLRKTTSDNLYAKFKPIIDVQLNKTGATKYWSEAVTKYNKIPLIQNKLPEDISDYVANEAMDGIYYMIEKEEGKIRQDPLTRTKEVLKKVFAYADDKKN